MADSGNLGVVAVLPDEPRSLFKVSVDDKGRLKLPTAIVEYLQALGETKVYITTVDLREVRIYPLSKWKEAEKLLQESSEDIELREHVALVASAYGKDDELDAQGRLTLPPDLRKELGLEKDETRVRWFQGHVRLVSSQEHERKLSAAKENLEEKVTALKKKGL